jgi:hypothetical protein
MGIIKNNKYEAKPQKLTSTKLYLRIYEVLHTLTLAVNCQLLLITATALRLFHTICINFKSHKCVYLNFTFGNILKSSSHLIDLISFKLNFMQINDIITIFFYRNTIFGIFTTYFRGIRKPYNQFKFYFSLGIFLVFYCNLLVYPPNDKDEQSSNFRMNY